MYNRHEKNRYQNNRSLEVGAFIPRTWGEQKVLDIALSVGEKDVRFLKSVLDRYGLHLIERAYGELQDILAGDNEVHSKAKLLNWLIQKKLKGGDE